MKNYTQVLLRASALLALLSTLNLQPSTAFAQGTAFTYQGRLNSGGSLANGSYDVAFTLYATNQTGVAVAGPVTNTAVAVTNGLFTTTINFGPGIFTGTNYWLEIAVSTNGANAFSTLAPRQPLTPVPYAIFAETASAAGLTGTIPAADIGGNYGNPVNFGNGLNSFDGTFYGLFYGSSFVGGTFVGSGSGLSDVWHTDGNLGTLPALNYLGTADNQPLIIKVNGQEAFRFEPAANAPNVIGGYAGNSVGGVLANGITIGGGGEGGLPNTILGTNATFATIAGGVDNTINGTNTYHSVIGGGSFNTISGGDVEQSTIAGGTGNSIHGAFAVVGGGYYNTAGADRSTVGGGIYNSIDPSDVASTIAGGHYNEMDGNVTSATIGGGYYNVMQTNAIRATIAGGNANTIQAGAWQSTIGGGAYNAIGTNAFSSTIAGGANNTVGNSSSDSSIGGGIQNTIQTNMPSSFIGGGEYNSISYNLTNPPIGFTGVATVGGGYGNRANGILSFVGGGIENIASGIGSAVLGGNVSQYTASNGAVWFSPGSGAYGLSSTVVGGAGNQANGDFSLAAGYYAQANHSGTFVWADSQLLTLSSTTSNEFSIRAQNGVRVVTDKGVHLNAANEPIIVRDWDVFATNAPSYKAGIGRWGMFIEPFNLTLGIPDTNTGDNLPRYFQVATYATNGAYTPLMVVDQSGNVTAAGSINGNGTGLNNVNAATLNGLASSNFWTTTGNAGTTPGANYIGTSDNQRLLIRGSFVGIGRTNVIGSEVFGVEAPVSTGYGGMYMDTTGTAAKPFYGYALGGSFIAWSYVDGSDGSNKWKLNIGGGDRLTVQPNGYVGIGTTSPTNPLAMGSGAYCSAAGVWTSVSDRNAKEDFTTIAPSDVLAKVAALPITQWKYKVEPEGVKHLGPVAQDFYAAFGLGDNDRAIGSIDESGVALAAIQGLDQKVESDNAALRAENAQLKQELTDLKVLVQQLAQARQN